MKIDFYLVPRISLKCCVFHILDSLCQEHSLELGVFCLLFMFIIYIILLHARCNNHYTKQIKEDIYYLLRVSEFNCHLKSTDLTLCFLWFNRNTFKSTLLNRKYINKCNIILSVIIIIIFIFQDSMFRSAYPFKMVVKIRAPV